MTVSPIERASAALREEVNHQWRDWTRYLAAQLTLLDVRAAERRVAFERSDTLEDEAARARTTLAALPPARRALFDQLRDERRQAVQAEEDARRSDGRVLDPDLVERQALVALQDEALATNDPDGWGVVPLREGATVTWFEVHVPSLRDAPTAASYALGEGDADSMRTRAILAGLLVAGGVLFFLVWFLWPRGGGSLIAATAPATANGVALTPWPITAVIVERTGQDAVTLSIGTEAPSGAAPSARWYPEHLVPLRLCLPTAVLADATRITLRSAGAHPDRAYTLPAAQDLPTDLSLEPCDGSATPRAATLQQTLRPLDAPLGEAQAFADGSAITLTDVAIVGPGDEPTLPSAQARVRVQVQAAISDWAAVAPTLLLAGGQTLLPAEAPVTTGDATTLTYLIPLPAAAQPIAWSITAPGAAQPLRWRATLPAPPTRAAVVRDALRVTTVTPALRDGTLTLTLQLRNERAVSFSLTPADLQLTRGSGAEALALTFPEPEALAAPLAPGATRTLTLTAPMRSTATDPLILSVGPHRFRLTWAG